MLEFSERCVLDKGVVAVIDIMGNDKSVVDAARVSYGQGTRSTSDDRALIRYLMMHRHTSPFEMCEIKFYIKAPLFVVRQWVRHRTANFNEYSGRYSEMPNEFYFPAPEMLQKQSKNNKQCSEGQFEDSKYQEILAIMQNITNSAHDEYRKLIDLGVARETARCILPLNVYTHFYWKIDAHNLMHFLKLRCEKNSQAEIRAYANEILKIFAEWMPLTYEAFMDYVINAESYSDQAHHVLLKAVDEGRVNDLINQDACLSQREKNVLRNRLTKPSSE